MEREWQRFIFSPNRKIPNLVCSGGQCGDSFMKEVCGLPEGWFTTRGKSVKLREYHLNYGSAVQQNHLP